MLKLIQPFCGISISDYIKINKSFSVIEFLETAIKISKVLSLVHSENLVHCDVKPHNLLINDKKDVFLIDFGEINEMCLFIHKRAKMGNLIK